MLEVHQVDVHYGDIQALWNVSFRVENGEIVSLIGSNGAGKTTVLKTISGILSLTKGSVTIDGVQLNTIKPIKSSNRVCLWCLREEGYLGYGGA